LLRDEDIQSLHDQPATPDVPMREWRFDDRWRVPRSTVLKGMLAAGVAASMSFVEMFPLARDARADGYDIWTSTTSGPCGSGGYASGHGCSPGCGPSTVCDGTSDGSCCSGGWHRNDGTEYSGYQLRPGWSSPGSVDTGSLGRSSGVVDSLVFGW
jgi:hypothetical protein